MPWEHSLDISIPFWAVRTVAGLLMIVGYLVFVLNIVQTYLASRPTPQEAAVARA